MRGDRAGLNGGDKDRNIAPFNPFIESFHENRYELYRKYLDEGPVHWGVPAAPTLPGCWYVFGYEEIVTILRDSRFTRTAPTTEPLEKPSLLPTRQSRLWELTTRWMLLSDPPSHGRYRNIFQKGFSEHFDNTVPARISHAATSLIRSLPESGTFDLVAEYALPLPLTVICQLLGVPEEHHQHLKLWSQLIFSAVDLKSDAAKYEAAAGAAEEVVDLLGAVVSHKRRYPKQDIISTVLSSRHARQLSDHELIANISLLLFAGHETTAGLIGNSVLALLRHRCQWTALQNNHELISSAIDEGLRHESPVQATTRFAGADLDLAGRKIRKGELLCLMLGAGNRDSAQFSSPDEFNMARKPGRHLGYGYGPHYCIGSALGSLEGQIALHTLLTAVPHIELTTEKPEWQPSITIRELKKLPVHGDTSS